MKRAKATISGIFGPDGQSLMPVYIGRRGAPKGNRNAERDGQHNREAKARRARLSAFLREARASIAEADQFLREERAARMLARNQRQPCKISPNST